MKRRFLALALVLAVAFALCACGQTSNLKLNIKQSAKEGNEKLASVENCHLVLRLTINPQLELYLDEAGTVLKAAAGNKDGKKLLAELDLSGLAYSDAVNAILSGADEQGLLAENAGVQIDVLASADGPLTWEQTQQLEQTVTDYSEDLSASTDQSTVVAAQCGASIIEVEEAENGDVWYSYYSSDVTCIREICYGADGSYTEWVYLDGRNATDVLSIAPDGTRQEEHMTCYSDGTRKTHEVIITDGISSSNEFTEYYENGNLKTSNRVRTDGTASEEYFEEYYENGNQKTYKTVHSDGTVAEQRFAENGNPIYRFESSDNHKMEEHYYANGNPKTAEEHCPNGEFYIYRYTSYGEDGSRHIIEKAPDGTTREYYYDADGRPVEN